jgi:tol-pal system protein YbgF
LLGWSLAGTGVASESASSESPIKVESLSSAPIERQLTEEYLAAPIADEPAPIFDEESSSRPNMENQYQLQILQQEVMTLRGQIEELRYEVQRGKAVQEDRYLELDRRLQGLGTLSASQLPAEGDTEIVDSQVNTFQTEQPGLSVDADEKPLYDAALRAIRDRQYDEAIEQLLGVIKQFPDGTYTPNAYYWLGEVQAAKKDPDYEKARQALVQVINGFPNHSKVPDAAFKLGKIYHLMGDCQRGKDLLMQVAADHSGKTAGKLAQNYVRDNIDC